MTSFWLTARTRSATRRRGLGPSWGLLRDPAVFDYDTNLWYGANLSSASIALGSAQLTLSFSSFLETEVFSGFDVAKVRILTDGVNFDTTLTTNHAGASGGDGDLADASG